MSASCARTMLEALICPVSQGPLDYDAKSQELISRRAGLAYPIRGGIPIMLEAEARPLSYPADKKGGK